jgi:RES domain-containing protein
VADREGEARRDGFHWARALRAQVGVGTRAGRRSFTRAARKSLAALENLVHLNPPVFFRYVVFAIEFADELIHEFRRRHCPAGWSSSLPGPTTKAIGDQWVRASRSAVLAVPSVIVPGEPNLLLNPAHADFKSIAIGKPEPFSFDPRLLA